MDLGEGQVLVAMVLKQTFVYQDSSFLVDKLDPSEDQENKTLEELNAESWITVFNRTVLNFDQ